MSGSISKLRAPGDLLDVGVTAEVFAYGADSVVKILKPGVPEQWAAIEATNTVLVHDVGVPTPEVLDTGMIGRRPAIVFRRVCAPTMADMMLAEPSRVPALAALMADIQRDICMTKPPDGLAPLRSRIRDRVEGSSVTSSQARGEALEMLQGLGEGTALCHGDLHPGNILLGDGGPVVIDWFDAAVGSALADVVRSSLLLRLASDSAGSLPHFPGASAGLVASVHDAYITAAFANPLAIGAVDQDELRLWENVIAIARLAESVPPAGLVEIWSQRDNDVSTSPLIEGFVASTSGVS